MPITIPVRDGPAARTAWMKNICAALFATRDNVFRGLVGENTPPVLLVTLVSVAAAAVVTLTYVAFRQRGQMPRHLANAAAPFGAAGLVLGLAYVTLIGALDRGDVTLLAPLNATQSLWAIAFAALLVGRREDAIGYRLIIAAALVVAGSAFVAAFR